MIELIQIIALTGLLAVGSLGPGLVLLQPFRLRPVERLCLAVAGSLVVLYLLAFAIYAFDLSFIWYYVVSAVCLFCVMARSADLVAIWRNRIARQTILAFVFLLLWCGLHLSLVTHYSGGGWASDWIEHYERARFFTHQQPLDTVFIRRYTLPARPPMMNLITGFFTAQVGSDFWVFQLVMMWLNLLAVLPCVLIMPWLSRCRRPALLPLTLAFMCSPFFLVNATYTWTKLFAGFYVVLALALYLTAWQQKKSSHMVFAFLCLTAGVLVHYSAAPFAVLVGLHYLVAVLRHRTHRLREVATIAAFNVALAATWFGWSILNYGFSGTIASNTTVTDSAKLSAVQNLTKMAANVYRSVVPHPLTVPYEETQVMFSQPSTLGFLRDYAFMFYQTNLLVIGGVLSMLAIAFVIYRLRIKPSLRWFWLMIVVPAILIGPATHGAFDPYGVAHVVFIPLALLIVTAIACNFAAFPRWLSAALLLSWLVDYVFGVALQFWIQSLSWRPEPDELLSHFAMSEWSAKHDLGWLYVGDLAAPAATIVRGLIVVILLVVFALVVRRYIVRDAGCRRSGVGPSLAE